jgi:hypothetical protein
MSTISPQRPRHTIQRTSDSHTRPRRLGRYTDHRGHEREIVAHPAVNDSVLVIDRLTITQSDARLVAHLAPDEPAENARLVSCLYLNAQSGRSCRRLTEHDLTTAPAPSGETHTERLQQIPTKWDTTRIVDEDGAAYRLAPTATGMSIPELRWLRQDPDNSDEQPESISMRDVIGKLESYEPVRSITARALAARSNDPTISTTVLQAELRRMDASPIVLNRGLREAVIAAIGQGVSMSEIALRCGRVKRDTHGHTSGETSWLARRIGQRAEGGESTPSPWIHSETLALIARQGLNVAPREVELG